MKLPSIVGSAALAGAVAVVIAHGGLTAQAPAQPQAPAPAQGRGAAPAQGRGAAQTAQQTALIDLTGNWVSVIDQDWRFRMMTPPAGDFAQVPLTAAGRGAVRFDAAQYGGVNYQTSGIVDCRAYGGANLLRMPTRLRISWDSPNVLKIETDWGQQTRLLRFNPAQLAGDVEQLLRSGEIGGSRGAASMQGYSAALWEIPYRFNQNFFQPRAQGTGRAGGGLGAIRAQEVQEGGTLAVVTTDLAPGWLRRNGAPYSARTRMIEHFMTFQDPTGKDWFTVTIEVIDPEYLNTPFYISAEFQKEPDGSKWAPHPCKQVG
ncbi:MAG: hypothetical protein WBD07_10835 [Vicinamibacterales bacterium]